MRNGTVTTRASYTLIILGIALWTLSIFHETIWWVAPQYEFGLLQVLPIHFWVGLICYVAGFLTIATKIGRNKFLVLFLLLNSMVVGIPIIVEPNARIQDAWWHLGTAKTIINNGNIESKQRTPFTYLEWPGSFLFNAMALIASDAPAPFYIRIFPLVSSSIFLLGYYLFLSQLSDSEIHRRYGAISLLFLDPWLNFHNSPQAFALMLFPLVLLALSRSGRKWVAIAMLLYVSIVVSHPVTSIFLILIAAASCVLLKIFRTKENNVRTIILFLTLLTSWFVFVAVWNFESSLRMVFERGWFASLTEQSTTLLQTRLVLETSSIRLTASLFAFSMTLVSLILHRANRKRFALVLGWIAAVSFIMTLDLAVFKTYFNDRPFMFLGLLTAPFCIEPFMRKRATKLSQLYVLGVVFVLAANFSTFYYLENDLLVNNSNVATVEFAIGHRSTRTGLYGDRLDVAYLYEESYSIFSMYYYDTKFVPSDSIMVFDFHSLLSKTPNARFSRSMKTLYATYAENPQADSIYSNGLFFMYYVGPP
jgi:hypothetical protein